MTNYESLGLLITKTRDLLDSIRGGAIRKMKDEYQVAKANMSQEHSTVLSDFARQSNAKIEEQQAAIDKLAITPILEKMTRLSLTINQVMKPHDYRPLPRGFGANKGVTFSLVETIRDTPMIRSAAASELLTEMETDIKTDYPDFNIRADDAYISDFYVYRVSWDFEGAFSGEEWLFMPDYHGSRAGGMPSVGISTAASFIKLESGIPEGYFVDGGEIGKWKFSSRIEEGLGFGRCCFPNPITRVSAGSFLIALPVVSTGVINHPRNLFSLSSLDYPSPSMPR